MSKYDRWHNFLTTLNADEIVVTFQQLDKIASLPRAARMDSSWWASDDHGRNSTPQARSWLDAGYQAHPDLDGKCVSFKKTKPVNS